jgi:hypothetical protein
MLIALDANEEGWIGSFVYNGGPFDSEKFELVRGGWDHEHCYICYAKVLPDDEWWVTTPPSFDEAIGLCLDCHARLLGNCQSC